jgi:hypothetical protein
MNKMNKIAAAALVALSLVACAPGVTAPNTATATTTAAPMLDGRTFDVMGDKVPEGMPKQIQLEFANGSFLASPCKEMGRPPIPYTVAADGTFRAERHDPNTDDVWSGRIVGNNVEGRVVSTNKKDGKVLLDIAFRGQAR